MIPRYSRPEMARIWEPENKFRIWFEIEAHATDAMAELGVIPQARPPRPSGRRAKAQVRHRPDRRDRARGQARRHRLPDPSRRDRRPRGALPAPGHDLVRRARHLLRRAAVAAADMLIDDVDVLLAALKRRAFEHKLTADHRPQPRHPRRADHLRPQARRPTPSSRAPGAAGRGTGRRSPPAPSPARSAPSPTSTRGSKSMWREKMGLAVEPVSTQVIPRDRHAMFFATLGVVASSIERLAIEIRHLQRTEVLEAEEYFSPGQKGSSAMPHKRNPVLTENLTGLARMVRAAACRRMENVALWHERDISPLVGRARHRAGRHRDARLRPGAAWPASSTSSRLSRQHAPGTWTSSAGWCTRSACCWP